MKALIFSARQLSSNVSKSGRHETAQQTSPFLVPNIRDWLLFVSRQKVRKDSLTSGLNILSNRAVSYCELMSPLENNLKTNKKRKLKQTKSYETSRTFGIGNHIKYFTSGNKMKKW